jgi:TonB family protein
MKKAVTILSIMLCFFGTAFEIKACSPAHTPFKEWLSGYNSDDYMIVEGYFQPVTEGYYAKKLMVTRSSHSSIKVGQEYEVFEYGPFGSMCENYELSNGIERSLAGKTNPRLIIVYKNRSINGKLVTPIFWAAGVKASNNKIVSNEYDDVSRQYVYYECSSSYDTIWKRILEGNAQTLEWKTEKEIQITQSPMFIGGEKALLEYLQENMKYPVGAYKRGVQGDVSVRFTINKSGSITNVTVQKSLDPDCDKEAVRLVENMPKWIPSIRNGKNVNVDSVLSVHFNLRQKLNKKKKK